MNPMICLDVWLQFDDPDEDEATREANVYVTGTTVDDLTWRAEWYHNAVGVVSSEEFPTYEKARGFLTRNGFVDYQPTPIIDYALWLENHEDATLAVAEGYVGSETGCCNCCGVEYAWTEGTAP